MRSHEPNAFTEGVGSPGRMRSGVDLDIYRFLVLHIEIEKDREDIEICLFGSFPTDPLARVLELPFAYCPLSHLQP